MWSFGLAADEKSVLVMFVYVDLTILLFLLWYGDAVFMSVEKYRDMKCVS